MKAKRFFRFMDPDAGQTIYFVKESMVSALESLVTYDLGDCEFMIFKEVHLADAQEIQVTENDATIKLSDAELDAVYSNLT